MPEFTLEEAITASFYAWEIRGRGWWHAPHAVRLEPPHRPFFVLPELATGGGESVDDGRRLGFIARLLARRRGTVPPAQAPEPYEELAPFAATESPSRVSLAIELPNDYGVPREIERQLLVALATAQHPLSWEYVGAGSVVSISLCGDADDIAPIVDLFAVYAPELVVGPETDPTERWPTSRVRWVVEIALRDEFFLPIHTLPGAIDPFVPLLPALARAGVGEFVAVQVLFERVRNPGRRPPRGRHRTGRQVAHK